MELFIQFTMILLILSMITEKVSNLVKLNAPGIFKDDKGKTIESKVQLLSIVVGVAIALISKANIFQMFSSQEFELFWDFNTLGTELTASNIVGSVICGFFLSLGSKFFHDLLDMLLHAKNLKRKLVQKESWNFDDISDVDQYLEENEVKAIDIYLKQYFQRYSEVSYFEFDSNEYKVNVTLRSSMEDIPDTIPFKTKLGKVIELEVQKMVRD
ncbi:MAG: hypothetical protein HQ522_22715 [Bacteroidetes bacterium]|nr:hypothetical protein [Bacteroidota bacterium]